MKTLKSLVLAIAAIAIPTVATAGSPLADAACDYRDAVKQFERDVYDFRYIEHYQRRLVNRLEDAACDLHSASRRLDRLERLECTWDDVLALHTRVRSELFGSSCSNRAAASLARSWQCVERSLRNVKIEIDRVCAVGHRDDRFGPYGPVVNPPTVRAPRVPVPGNPYANPRYPLPEFRAPVPRSPHDIGFGRDVDFRSRSMDRSSMFRAMLSQYMLQRM